MKLKEIQAMATGEVPSWDLMHAIAVFLRGKSSMGEKKQAMALWDETLGLEPTQITDEDVEFFLREVLFVDMLPTAILLGAAYGEGLRVLTGTVSQVSREIGVPYRTLQSRKYGVRGVSPEAARQLASFIRTRSRRLGLVAGRLERAAEREAAHG